jgi:hypothetical protein
LLKAQKAMILKLILKNENTGFFYEVTAEEIAAHQKYSVEKILYWLEDMNKFLREVQLKKSGISHIY